MQDQTHLVLAMPRRELFRINGFTRKIEMDILESLSGDTWYAMPASLEHNYEAKEVRLGVVVTREQRGEQILINEYGVALHATPIPPEAGQLGPGLVSLRQLALVAGKTLVGVSNANVELVGYCNDDSLPECRPYFLLVYRLRVPVTEATPPGMNWISKAALHGVPLDPVSALVMGSW